MTATERFLHYVTYNTQSDETSDTVPSSLGQLRFGAALAAELRAMELEVHQAASGAVYAFLPASPGHERAPAIALLAHLDTAPRVPGENVKAKLVRYTGGDLVLNREKGIVLTPEVFPDLKDQMGKELIVTDGTTLLGADDKAGVAEIVTALEALQKNPDIPHGRVAACFTPDEEVGLGADYVDLSLLKADFGYTVDGGPLGTLESENFNAASAEVLFHGVNIHPGEAKGKMKNACLMAADFIARVPPEERPDRTEGYEGFYHLCGISGDESEARLSWLIRDHDREGFEARKALLRQIAGEIETQYRPASVELKLSDSYYNMKEKLLPHPQILERARRAFLKIGVQPWEPPIRGGTDGARLSYMGLPCPNLSAGGYHFHGIYEYVPRESLEKMAEMLTILLTDEGAAKG